MEFKEILRMRRSVRKYAAKSVPTQIIDRLTDEALSVPSARNTRSTRLMIVDDPLLIARMSDMRDYGSAFLRNAPLAIVVVGETALCDLWRENAAIVATTLQLACVDEGLDSCWVHIHGRPRRKDHPEGEQAADYLRSFLPIPDGCEPLCAVAIGYSDFKPTDLPPFDKAEKIIRLK